MAKIHQAYQSLLKHSEKREMLEKSARAKLQAVIINLSDANKVTIFAPKLKKKGLDFLRENSDNCVIIINCDFARKNPNCNNFRAKIEKFLKLRF